MTITTRPLSRDIGVELVGFDPLRMSDADRDQFLTLFRRHHLLLIRNLDLTDEQHLALCELVGPISGADNLMKGGRKYTHISNVHADGRLPAGELLFHSDHMFLERPLKAISLFALQVPRIGGETRWVNVVQACRTLPEDLRARIRNLQALHIYDYDANAGDKAPDPSKLGSNSDTHVHPLLWRDSDSGEEVLFASRLFTVEILGLPRAESQDLLERLFRQVEGQPSYDHKWQVGDYIIWNNRLLQHARNDFAPTENRALRRVPVGDRKAA
jgi:alpha-ketoglutarate-dependent taurine dioxygenase